MTERSRRLQHCLYALVAVLALIFSGSCERNQRPSNTETSLDTGDAARPLADQPSNADEEPLLLLDDEPLLLLEDDSPSASSNGPVANNMRCFVCHANYRVEKIAVTHARANIGCAQCHGESDAHIADESWGSGGNGTAPDIMYPKDTIVPACMKCHTRDKIDIPAHEPVFTESKEKKVCTDCHGKHRLTARRCKWK